MLVGKGLFIFFMLAKALQHEYVCFQELKFIILGRRKRLSIFNVTSLCPIRSDKEDLYLDGANICGWNKSLILKDVRMYSIFRSGYVQEK